MKNHGNMPENYRITLDEAGTLLSILRQHDGSTLTPELDFQGRKDVSRLFYKLRFNLGGIADQDRDVFMEIQNRYGISEWCLVE